MSRARLDAGEQKAKTGWETAGWTRAPRNGYEWKRLRDGKTQPEERDKRWAKAYKCRICGGKLFKVIYIAGRAARNCIACRTKARKKYAAKRWKTGRTAKDHKAYREALRAENPVFMDGFACVSATWVRENMARLEEITKDGTLIVEYGGTPICNIVHWSQT